MSVPTPKPSTSVSVVMVTDTAASDIVSDKRCGSGSAGDVARQVDSMTNMSSMPTAAQKDKARFADRQEGKVMKFSLGRAVRPITDCHLP